MDWVLESRRLGFRLLRAEDFELVRPILQDAEVMYAWEHAFSDDEVREWIGNNLARYAAGEPSYMAAVEKSSGRLAGLIGPLIETIDGARHMGVAYILAREFWGRGLAAEGAGACVAYAFERLGARRVIAEIRPENLPSRRVAERLGMTVEGSFVKRYRGKDMPHLLYSLTREKAGIDGAPAGEGVSPGEAAPRP